MANTIPGQLLTLTLIYDFISDGRTGRACMHGRLDTMNVTARGAGSWYDGDTEHRDISSRIARSSMAGVTPQSVITFRQHVLCVSAIHSAIWSIRIYRHIGYGQVRHGHWTFLLWAQTTRPTKSLTQSTHFQFIIACTQNDETHRSMYCTPVSQLG